MRVTTQSTHETPTRGQRGRPSRANLVFAQVERGQRGIAFQRWTRHTRA